jgi:hypothetical protein
VAQDADALMDELGAEATPVRNALVRLRTAGLVSITQDRPRLYRARTVLDALTWARAVDAGVPLPLLEAHAQLDHKERQKALALASSGEVARVQAEEARQKQADNRAIRLNRAQSLVAATELGRLVEDARRSLMASKQTSTQKRLSPIEKAALVLLEQTVEEGQRSLSVLQRSIIRE